MTKEFVTYEQSQALRNFGFNNMNIEEIEKLIKIKSQTGAQLTDRELSVRWWGRLSVDEKRAILNEYSLHDISIMDSDSESVYWVWLKQQKL
jgi:hypothetical protein